MKYVINKRNNVLLPVVGAEHVNHSDLHIKDCEIVGAGRFSIKSGVVTIYPCTCTSIDFTTKDAEYDKDVLYRMFLETGMTQFLEFN